MKYNTHRTLGLLGAMMMAAAMSACAPVNATLAAGEPECNPVAAKALVKTMPVCLGSRRANPGCPSVGTSSGTKRKPGPACQTGLVAAPAEGVFKTMSQQESQSRRVPA